MRTLLVLSALAASVVLLAGCGNDDVSESEARLSSAQASYDATIESIDALAPAPVLSQPPVYAPPTAPVPERSTPNQPAGLVSESTWPGEWPFTVPEGVLLCGAERVNFVANRVLYALNGAAVSIGGADDVTAIWKESAFPGVRVDMGPMIEKGLTLC